MSYLYFLLMFPFLASSWDRCPSSFDDLISIVYLHHQISTTCTFIICEEIDFRFLFYFSEFDRIETASSKNNQKTTKQRKEMKRIVKIFHLMSSRQNLVYRSNKYETMCYREIGMNERIMMQTCIHLKQKTNMNRVPLLFFILKCILT